MVFTYDHPHPAVTVDLVVVTPASGERSILLVRRGSGPFRDCWALPGGFVGIDEDLEQAARRELVEETGVEAVDLEQVGAFGRPDRDPRERVISIAYLAVIEVGSIDLHPGSDASDARLFPLDDLPELAFDHAEILEAARARLFN